MLSERIKVLLCRAVDGELSERQRRGVERLLQDSDEARALYHRLQNDSKRMRAMPRNKLPARVSTQILQSIGHESFITPAAVGRSAQRYLPMWANLAAALAVLLAVSAGTYLIVTINDKQRAEQQSAEQKPQPDAIESGPKAETQSINIARGPSRTDAASVESLPMPREDDEIASTPMPELPDAPDPDNKSALGVPFNESLKLFRIDMPRLPPVLPVRELDRAVHRSILVDTLKSDEAVQLDLFCKDANKACERVQQVLRSQGKKVIVDMLAQKRLQARLKTNFVVYSESLTADDFARLFAALAAEDRKGENHQLEKLVVAPLSPTSQRTLGTLLGVDPKLLNLKAKPATIDPQKPLQDSTAENLARALEKDRTAAPARPAESTVLALSYNPIRPNPELSKEVREFLAGRKERKPGMIAVMLVVRNID